MNDYKIPLRRKFLMYVEGGQPVPPPPPPPIVKWLDVTRTDGLAESDRAAIAVFKAAGLCENDDYMTTEEAAAVVQLPSFRNITALVDWDWSALSGMDNENLYSVFYNCANVNFAQIPQNFADKATDMRQVFALCTKLALTSLPDGFGSVATNMHQLFNGCTKLALTSLPDGFGSVATNMQYLFNGCTKLALTSLPSDFGAVATDITSAFRDCSQLALTSLPSDFGAVATDITGVFRNCSQLALTSLPPNFGAVATDLSYIFLSCSSLALTSLPPNFGAVATNISSIFNGCSKIALTSLPPNFGAVATNMTGIFNGCISLALTSLPPNFGAVATDITSAFRYCSQLALTSLPPNFGAVAINMANTFRYCVNLRGAFDLGNSNFGRKATNLVRCFNDTNITSFSGYFDFSSVNNDTLNPNENNAIEQFIPTTCTHVMFVANTLKYSLVNSAANLTNIDTESLLSLAECLSSSASGKTWTVTSAQFDTLMSEMYSETLSYIMYVMTKGWNVESA